MSDSLITDRIDAGCNYEYQPYGDMRSHAEKCERALRLVMSYPHIRKYLGSQISKIADDALEITHE